MDGHQSAVSDSFREGCRGRGEPRVVFGAGRASKSSCSSAHLKADEVRLLRVDKAWRQSRGSLSAARVLAA